jgi:Ca2+-binding RTX toxin-like protein
VRSVGGAAAMFAVLAIAAPAIHAGTPTYDPALLPDGVGDPEPVPRTFTYLSDPGQNRLGVSVNVDGALQISDALAPGGVTGCETGCPLFSATVQSVSVDLGDENDSIVVGPDLPPTTVRGGPGSDRADFSDSNTAATITDVEEATGGSADDKITAAAAGSTVYGQGGADTITGGAGDDTLLAGDGADTVDAGDGDDTVLGGDGDDRILAADGVDDTISCGPGNDTVDADLGAGGATDLVDASCERVTGTVEVSVPVPTTSALLPVPVLAPGIAAPRDLTAPRAYLRSATRQRLRTALTRGVLAPVGCAEACGVSMSVLLDRAIARRLDLAGRSGPAIIGTRTTRLSSAGRRTLRVRFTRDARRALRTTKRAKVTLQVLVSDAAGNGTLLQRRVALSG